MIWYKFTKLLGKVFYLMRQYDYTKYFLFQ